MRSAESAPGRPAAHGLFGPAGAHAALGWLGRHGEARKASRLCFLRADGSITGSDGEETDSVRAHLLVLSRGLCRFHLFPNIAGAPRSRTEAAAEIYCEVRAPFETSDNLKVRTPRGIAIWSWNRAQVQALIADRGVYYRGRILPESLAYPAGDGWCQRTDLDGFEAQYWEGGALVASMWRRRPFEAEQWEQFTAEVEDPAVPAPDAPPPPQPLELPSAIGATPRRVRPRWGWAELERGVAIFALLAVGFGAYHQGRATSYERAADTDVAALDRSLTQSEANPENRLVSRELGTARAFVRLGGGETPLDAAADAFTILGGYGFNIPEWSVDDLAFQARVSPVPDLALVRDVASVLESHPRFANVSSQYDRAGDRLIIQAELQPRGAPPLPEGGAS